MESFYPVFLDLRGKKCLVVGGGTVATRKVKMLLKCRAGVTVVSPAVTPYLKELAAGGWLQWFQEPYQSRHLEGAVLAIGATGDEEVNRQVAKDCRLRNIPVNIVDRPEWGTFYVPSVVSRGPLTIAISTEGRSPAFARRVREELEEKYTDLHGAFVSYLGGLRQYIQEELPDPQKRRELLRELASAEFFKMFESLPAEAFEEQVAAIIARYRAED